MGIYGHISIIGLVVLLGGCVSSPQVSNPAPVPLLLPPPALLEGNVKSIPTTNDQHLDGEDEDKAIIKVQKIGDLERYIQNIEKYVSYYGEDQNNTYNIQKTFWHHYYRPWRYTAVPISAKEASWPINAYNAGYGSNLKPIPKEWFITMGEQSNFASFGAIGKPAIALRWMSVRVFPTQKPLYKDPAKPGNGYPFDMLQNNSVSFNEPLFLSHYSLDGSWAYVFTNNASGWVETNGISIITPEQIDFFQNKEKLFITEDAIALRDNQNRFVAYSRIGMVLPLLRENNESLSALYVDASGNTKELVVPKQSARVGIQLINKNDLAKIGNQLLKNTYGWGEMYEERDCSSMIRDYMTPFGIWLPRNSAQQAKKGEVISFKDMNNSQKLTTIKEKGIPFETIIYKKGHVLLYVGTVDDTVLVMHNIWGIRTKDKMGIKGRVIVGRAVVSTLELGSEIENFDPENMLLNTITSMNVFTRTPSVLVRKK
jgi:hypothetical protein